MQEEAIYISNNEIGAAVPEDKTSGWAAPFIVVFIYLYASYFFRKLINATAIRLQSIIVAPIRTARAPPEITAILIPPYIHPIIAQMTISTASTPRINPTNFTDCLIVGLSYA